MVVKKRGRPANTSGRRQQQLLNIPDHIKARITSRLGKPPEHWIDVLQNMEEFQSLVTSYRRKFRIKECDALTLVTSFNENVEQSVLNEALLNVKCWKKFSNAGLNARGYEPPKWHEVARKLMAARHARTSDRQLAQFIQEHEKGENRIPPHERSIRRFLTTLKK